MDAGAAARELVDRVRARPWGLAVAVLDGDATEIRLDHGVDELTPQTAFQVGSLTKTITGLLLATTVVRGEATLDTTAGEVLGGRAGRLAEVPLRALATQRSGLPRLPPNLPIADPADPYADYTEDLLFAALREVEVDPSGNYEYSNFGFMVLGRVLREITGQPFGELAVERVFSPLGMATAGCPPPEDDRATGYAGAAPTPWWRTNLPGAGGIGMSITDLATYLRAHLDGSGDRDLDAAIDLSTTVHAEAPDAMGLGWVHQGGGWWHNGGTGGFSAFAAVFRPARKAVALLANGAEVRVIDEAGFAVLTELVRT